MNAKSIFVAMMGLGLSTLGCMSQEEVDELAAMDAPHITPQENPTGGNSTNHYDSVPYHDLKYKLHNAMNTPLGTLLGLTYSNTLNSAVYSTDILDTYDGRDLFKIAVECALPDGSGVYQAQTIGGGSPRWYYGKGLMKTATNWKTSALTTAQKEDVFRCVISRINATGTSVNIVLSGQNVTEQADENHNNQGWVPDALWDVKISTIVTFFGPVIIIDEYAWALNANPNAIYGYCSTIETALSRRVCDANSTTCNFVIGDPTTDCVKKLVTFADGSTRYNYYCGGRPVLQTWVQNEAFGEFYPSCFNVQTSLPPPFLPPVPNSP